MHYYLPYEKLNNLLNALRDQGYLCIGPTVQDNTIVFNELKKAGQLPWGVEDLQLPGKYLLEKTEEKKAFAWANGPQAIKPFLFKAKEHLWRVERDPAGKLAFKEVEPTVKPIALIGARSCDLAGMAVQDNVFLNGEYPDKRYQTYREHLFIIAVNCTRSGNNCFCVSTQSGPKACVGFDWALTEISSGFVVDVGSEKGRRLIQALSLNTAKTDQKTQADEGVQRAKNNQTKKMPYHNSRELANHLMKNIDHPHWENVADRCLSCGNCTAVCPTCFCHHETDNASLSGEVSWHDREWDSCFATDFSYIHGKVIRPEIKNRYKQWLTHKLGTWWEQFDSSGCVGCGRCITWCPVGIDLVEEVAAIINDKEKKDNENT